MNKRQKQARVDALEQEKAVLKQLEQEYRKASQDCADKIAALNARTDLQNLQSIIYQKRYQEMLKKQIDDAIKDLHSNSYDSIQTFLEKQYESGFVGTLYDLHGQGIPLTLPYNHKAVIHAIQNDSKLSKPMYDKLGEDVDQLKDSVRSMVSRGVATGKSWAEVAQGISMNMVSSPFKTAANNSMRIARTEGQRVLNQSQLDCQTKAKEAGADILKQWDAALDNRVRPWHREADGQIRELDEDFDVGGERMKAPCIGGSAKNVINCRCALLQRARWALDEETLNRMKERAAFYGLDKSESFEDFKQKYINIFEPQKLIESMRAKAIWNGLAEEKREAILSRTENADPEFLKMAERCMDNCTVDWSGLGTTGTSHYTDGTGRIWMFGEKDDDALARTFWHEYGHFMDDAEVSGSGVEYIMKMRSGKEYTLHGARSVVCEIGYEDAMAKDVQKIISDSGLDDQFYVKLPEDKYSHPWIYKKGTDEPLDWDDWKSRSTLEEALCARFDDVTGVTKARNYLIDMGYPEEPKSADYFEWYTTPKRKITRKREKFKGAQKAWEKKLRETREAQEAFENTHDMTALWKEKDRLFSEALARKEKLGGVSDTIDESTYGMFLSEVLLGGHSSDYYRTHPQALEGCANVFSSHMRGDPDEVKVWETLAPNLYDVITRGWMHGTGN